VGDPGAGAGDHHGLVLGQVGADRLVRAQANLLVLDELLLLSVDGDGVLLVLVGVDLDLVLADQDGDVLHAVDLLSQYHHGVVIVTGTV